MLCATGQTLSEELKAAGLEVSIAEADRDSVGVIAARGRKRNALQALNEHRENCALCSKPVSISKPDDHRSR